MTASLDRAAFFDHVRKPLFGGSLTAEQVQGMDVILDACPAVLPTDPLAYGLATTFREAGPTMQPIREIGRGKGRSYGRPTGPHAQIYYGRGLVQLTWLANYVKVTEKLRKLDLLKPDEDLARTPDLAMRPDIAAAILFHGMIEGWFTGKKLSDYFGHGKSNPRGARAIINGTDHAALIAGYFTHFRAALLAAKHGAAAAPAPAPPPVQPAPAPAAHKPQPVRKPRPRSTTSSTAVSTDDQRLAHADQAPARGPPGHGALRRDEAGPVPAAPVDDLSARRVAVREAEGPGLTMKWLLASLFVLGMALIAGGTAITNGRGSADERVAGAFPVLIGIGFLVTDVIIAFAWMLIRA